MDIDLVWMLKTIFITLLWGALGYAVNWGSDRYPFPYWYKLILLIVVGFAFAVWLITRLGLANLAI